MDSLDTLLKLLQAGFRDAFLQRFGQEEAFRTGCFWGLGLAALVGFVGREVYYLWEHVRAFFDASRRPATAPGPSPASFLGGCIGALLTLVIIMIVAVVLIRGLVGGIIGQ